jgi:hypothetical protein
VLGDGLAGRTEAVLGRQAAAQLEQRLAVPVPELVEDHAPGRVGEGAEHVTHESTIGKSLLA